MLQTLNGGEEERRGGPNLLGNLAEFQLVQPNVVTDPNALRVTIHLGNSALQQPHPGLN